MLLTFYLKCFGLKDKISKIHKMTIINLNKIKLNNSYKRNKKKSKLNIQQKNKKIKKFK